jgi:hypothetical protein
MISIPKIEKPSDKLIKLTRVEIICSVRLIVFFLISSRLNLSSPAIFVEHVWTIVNGTKDPVDAPGTFFWSAITHRTAGRPCPARGG